MNNTINRWLTSDGWIGIVSRVVCELIFFALVFNAVFLANWAEQWTSGRAIVITESKELLVRQAAIVMICVGLFVEVVNVVRLLIRKRRNQ
ncbi:hypothetical protein [Paraburkholderia caribensis]|jgi:hypothetical protein|uniref:hypothetical protein n=1 Tax=Paraburkholderia caribensis TaxID=75105 RepID=UPI0028594390|nr:hypothetical protein [Paraburkholderia caribensis]MDR6384941.1 hypothetical protein [Paraburkholderia caribensis]